MPAGDTRVRDLEAPCNWGLVWRRQQRRLSFHFLGGFEKSFFEKSGALPRVASPAHPRPRIRFRVRNGVRIMPSQPWRGGGEPCDTLYRSVSQARSVKPGPEACILCMLILRTILRTLITCCIVPADSRRDEPYIYIYIYKRIYVLPPDKRCSP